MVNKDEVLRRLDCGLTPREIAEKLHCATGYVRATRARRNDYKAPYQRRMRYGRGPQQRQKPSLPRVSILEGPE